MSWLKTSDAAAWHPLLLEVLAHSLEEPWLVNEVFGFLSRCAIQSAQFELDYVVTFGVAMQTANGADRFKVLDRVCRAVGLWKDVEIPATADQPARKAFKIVEEDDLWHMIRKDEREWERQRRADVGNPELVIPVRHRDGDACRWCGHVVFWSDKKGGRGATYDHLKPGQGAASADDLVVACRSCNGARKDESNTDFNNELRPAPKDPYYSKSTAAFLARHGVEVQVSARPRITEPAGSTTPAAEQAPQRDTAPAPSSTAPTAHAAGSTAPATAAAHTAQRDTATGQERQREAVARDAGRPGATAAAGPAQRDEERRRPEDREQRIDEWLAARGQERAAEPIAPHDLEEIEWAPEPPAEDAPEPDLQIPADRQVEGSGFPGSGRDGSGQDGSRGGSGGSGRRKRRRGRRSGRGRGGAREG